MKSSKTKETSSVDIKQLLERLSKLPLDVSRLILYRTDYSQIEAICQAIKKKNIANARLQRLNNFCFDVNFWRDWLLENGYDLPETLPQLIEILQFVYKEVYDEKLNQLQILKALFFGNSKDLFSDFTNVFRTAYDVNFEDFPFTGDQFRQAVLDFEYIKQQIENFKWREENKRSRTFGLIPQVSDNFDPSIFADLPNKLSFEELFQFLADHDLFQSISDDPFDSYIWQKILYKKIAEDQELLRRLIEQEVSMIPLLAREGDELEFIVRNPNDERSLIVNYYYIDGKNKLSLFLQPISKEDQDRYNMIFPEEALPFLIKNKITTMADVDKWYGLQHYQTVSYIKDGEIIPFKETAKQKRDRLEKYR